MNDLKQLCERIVAEAPPMPDSAGVLAAARRHAIRYRLAQLAVGGAAAVVVAAAGALMLPGTADVGRAEHGAVFGAPVNPTSTPSASRVGGAAPGQGSHATTMSDLLTAAVPSGYTVSAMTGSAGGFGPFDTAQHSAGLWVADGHGRGQLAAAIVQPPGGQQSEPSNQCDEPPPTCEIVRVGDVTIKMSIGNVEDVGQNISAFRWLSVEEGGGYVMVWAFQGWSEYPGGGAPVVHPGLAVFPFTKQQIAELAASAEMFPPR